MNERIGLNVDKWIWTRMEWKKERMAAWEQVAETGMSGSVVDSGSDSDRLYSQEEVDESSLQKRFLLKPGSWPGPCIAQALTKKLERADSWVDVLKWLKMDQLVYWSMKFNERARENTYTGLDIYGWDRTPMER